MKTINLGSGITMTVPANADGRNSEFVELVVWRDGGEWWSDTLKGTDADAEYADCAKLRIPVAVLEGRAVPEPAKSEPDWRGFAEIVGGGDTHRVYVRWHGVTYYLCRNSLWDCERGFTFSTFAEAEAALAKAKHPGESA